MTIENKEIEFCSFMDSLINFELNHQSSCRVPIWQNYEQGVGKSIINLLCIVKAASLPNIEEKEVSIISRSIRAVFLKIAIEAFRKTKTYNRVQFGSGVTDKEKVDYEIVLGIFEIAISRVSQQNFIFLFKNLITFFPEEVLANNAFKTILQEYFQNKKLTLPRYEVNQIDGDQHDQLFKVSCFTSDGNSFEGCGSSKKKAETHAASVACNYYKINPNPTKIVKDFQLQLNDDCKISYKSPCLSKAFGLPDKLNLASAFSPTPLQKKWVYRIRATVG